jgi:ketosteroid isomerase-like protein
MDYRKDIIKHYFESWINKDISIIEEHFSKDIQYVECYGPEYNGINQIKQWFNDWNNDNKVLKWNIKRFIEDKNTTVVEWFFECEYNQNISSFDGVSIIEFDENNKIILVKEFEAKAEHIFPYMVTITAQSPP